MIDKRIDNKLRLAIETLKAFSKEDFFYWLIVYKRIYNLSETQCGFIDNFLRHGIREY
jgi:hypothetical protein